MQNALKTLGITPNQEVSLDVLLGESFNGRLYGMNDTQMERLSALRDIVACYESGKEPELMEITCSSEAATALYPSMRMLDHEEVAVLFLNTANTVIRKETRCRRMSPVRDVNRDGRGRQGSGLLRNLRRNHGLMSTFVEENKQNTMAYEHKERQGIPEPSGRSSPSE